jgi:hypothetical protein
MEREIGSRDAIPNVVEGVQETRKQGAWSDGRVVRCAR